MSRFLDHKQVHDAVHAIVAGNHVRCAVAFWGDGALKSLFKTKARAFGARIICDLTMGGTNPEELALLGAPNNPKLKHVEGLHAKLYLSSAGMVVTSANASNRGIGFIEPAKLIECGTFHRAGTKAYIKAEKWFEEIWDGAQDLDREALTAARAAWAKRPRWLPPGGPRSTRMPDTLLGRLASDPLRYRGVGVVFSSGEADVDDVGEAAAAGHKAEAGRRRPKLKSGEIDRLPKWPKGDLFTGWSDADARAWPSQFLCAHRGSRGAMTYWCYDQFFKVQLDKDEWSIFAERSATLRQLLELTGTPRDAARPEDEMLDRIFAYLDAIAGPDDWAHRVCESPMHLALLFAEVDAGPQVNRNPVE